MNCNFNTHCVCMSCEIKYPKSDKLIRCTECNQKLRWKPRNSKQRKKDLVKRIE